MAAGQIVTENFIVTSQDGSATETIEITVSGTNDGPVANADAYSSDENAPHIFAAADLLGNDTDVDGDTLTIAWIPASSDRGAALTLNTDGTVTYDASESAVLDALNDGDTAVDTFTYTVSDGNGGTDTATATVTVNGVTDITLTSWNNAYNGTASDEVIVALAGADTINGDAEYQLSAASHQSYSGGTFSSADSGNDVIYGNAGPDTLRGDALNFVNYYNSSGNAEIQGGNDTIYGGEDNDTVTGDAQYMRNENSFNGYSQSQIGGDDLIFGGNGGDNLRGDAFQFLAQSSDGGASSHLGGNDIINGEAGEDFIYGDADSAIVNAQYSYYSSYTPTTTLTGGDDVLNGGAGNDHIYGDFEQVVTNGTVSRGSITFTGGDDIIEGGAGNDHLYGDWDSANFSTATSITPTLVGGEDTFVFATGSDQDYIYDFQDGIDDIDVSAFDYDDISDLTIVVSDGHSVIDFGDGDTVTVLNVTTLAGDDFIF